MSLSKFKKVYLVSTITLICASQSAVADDLLQHAPQANKAFLSVKPHASFAPGELSSDSSSATPLVASKKSNTRHRKNHEEDDEYDDEHEDEDDDEHEE